MKKTTFFKSLLLTFGLMLISFTAIAATVTHTFSGTSGSVDSNIAFTTQKNSASSVPAFSTELRLYYSSTGDGCSLTLTPSNGAVITQVKITASSASYTPTMKYNVDGGSDGTATLASTIYTITGVNAATSLKFRNANTTNTQLRITGIEVTYSIPPTCTPSNLTFAELTINKLAADAPFTQSATSLNGTSAITYTSSNTGAATVNETTGEVSIVGAGSTIITASQAAGIHNAVDYCAAITTYTVNVASAAPTITVTEISVPDMAAYVGESDTETMNVSGINLTEGIALAISGANANQFTLSTNSVSQTGGVAANAVVSIYYNPTTAGTHTATLTISSAGATTVTRMLTGTSTWALLATPVATDATGINNTGFIANWNVVAGATEYQLDVTTLTVGGTSMPVLSESFVGFTAGTTSTPDGADKGSALDGLMQVNGWTGAKVYQAGGATKLGTSSVLGSLVTPSVNLSGSFNVSFKAMAWSGDSTKVKIYLNDVLVKTVSGLTNDANYTLTPFSVDLTGGTVGSKIKFEGNQAAKGRLFLDDIVISSGGGVAEQPIPGSPFTVIGDNSKSLTGLTEGTTYKYTVKAKNANVTSAVSNKITVVTTTGTGIGQLKGELKVYAHNGNVLLTTKAGNVIEIYNAVGQKLVSHKALEGLNTIPMRVSGVIFVKLGNEVAKVIM